VRRPLGCVLVAVGVVVVAFALWAVIAPGGNEADAIRVGGFFYLAIGAIVAVAGWALVRSQR
jgi:hypothetical protein